MTDFLRFLAFGTGSECQNEPKIHNTDRQCYEIWVHSAIPSSFRSPGNDEKSVLKSPNLVSLKIRLLQEKCSAMLRIHFGKY